MSPSRLSDDHTLALTSERENQCFLFLTVLAFCRDSAWVRRLDIRYQDFVCVIFFGTGTGIGVDGVLEGHRSRLGMPVSNGRVQ